MTQTQHDSPAQTHTAGVNAITLLTAQSREGQAGRGDGGGREPQLLLLPRSKCAASVGKKKKKKTNCVSSSL